MTPLIGLHNELESHVVYGGVQVIDALKVVANHQCCGKKLSHKRVESICLCLEGVRHTWQFVITLC